MDAGRVEAVFLTHAHSDHIDGLGELGMTRWLNSGSATPLPVYGPPVVEEVVAGFNRAYAPDVGYREIRQERDFAPVTVSWMEVSPFPVPEEGQLRTVPETDDGVRVNAFAEDHRPVTEAVGVPCPLAATP